MDFLNLMASTSCSMSNCHVQHPDSGLEASDKRRDVSHHNLEPRICFLKWVYSVRNISFNMDQYINHQYNLDAQQ